MSHAPSNGGRVSRTPWPCRLQPRPPSRTQPAEQMPQSFGSLSGPAGLLLGSLYTGLSFALGHSSKSKEGCVGDRLTLPRPARRGRPSPAPPASELGRSRGPPGARHPRRPLMPFQNFLTSLTLSTLAEPLISCYPADDHSHVIGKMNVISGTPNPPFFSPKLFLSKMENVTFYYLWPLSTISALDLSFSQRKSVP